MSPTTGPLVWFGFGNGTDDPSYNTYGIMGSSSEDVPIQTFINNITPLGVDTLPERCTMCENDSRGCQFPQEDVSTEGLRLGGTESGRCRVFGRRFDCHGRWDCVRYFEGRKKGVD